VFKRDWYVWLEQAWYMPACLVLDTNGCVKV
jgi:hypothetical protein